MRLKNGGTRCDGCGKLEAGAPKFKGFYMPPSVSVMTGRPDGRFPGIARAGKPSELIQLHACPDCEKKIKSFQTEWDFAKLPDGPLKKVMRSFSIEERLKIFNRPRHIRPS